MKKLLALGLAVLAVGGCKSRPLSVCVSPRVTGRVLAADTLQPLAGVKVIRNERTGEPRTTEPGKGGAALQARKEVRTDRDGLFVLEAERVLSPLGGGGWFSVDLLFERAGYERFKTNYSILNLSTNSWKDESALSAGDILLPPARK
ncbi:MAG TPA: hypothetical protein P5205_05640 [Candidatus Paceibacterota bacterium]|nr:hypothetical protein [Verrucomicrobiota bacterium]HSA09837.1 hypothetical protein [Candidatus Paceibacterota bacterium]